MGHRHTVMALIGAFAHFFVVVLLLMLGIAFGVGIFQRLGFRFDSLLEEALYAAGLFFAIAEIALFGLGMFGWLKKDIVLILLSLMAIVGSKGWLRLRELAGGFRALGPRLRQSPGTLFLAILLAGCLSVDALLAMAPLTGSDAMHYHFTVPLLEQSKAFEPMFGLLTSFFTGQNHLLISLGLVLGSDRISLGLIYLGGVLTVGALFVLARRLMPVRWALAAALTFVLSPMVYWQIGTSGSPDIWMAFYAALAVLALARGLRDGLHERSTRWLALAGFFAGVAAGGKYTGWAIPIAVVGWCFLSTRSWKRSAACGLWSLPTGIWPLVRNAWWTGDPLFPYLTRWLAPANFNAFTFQATLLGTRAPAFHRTLSGLLVYPLSLALKGEAYGFGQYFGPIVLAFAPLLAFAPWKDPLLRLAGFVWILTLLSNALTSQMGRFLLPVYPLILVLVFAGVAGAVAKGWRATRLGCWATLSLFFLFGIASEALYARDFLPVVVGRETQEAFLERMAPDYAITAFVNHTLEGQDGKVMVFFRYLYYLRVPFVLGDPNNSWQMDPSRYADSDAFLQLCHRLNVRWLVKAPEYPIPLAETLERLESEGRLQPAAAADVESFSGFRMNGQRAKIRVVILKLAEASP